MRQAPARWRLVLRVFNSQQLQQPGKRLGSRLKIGREF